MSKPIAFAPGAIREYLLSRDEFTALINPLSVTTRELPSQITAPCATIRAIGNVGVDPMLRRPLLTFNAWVPPISVMGGTTDPDEIAWDIAALAGQLIGRARNIKFRDSLWSGDWKTGPIVPDPETNRGTDIPLYRAFVTVELKMREKPAQTP